MKYFDFHTHLNDPKLYDNWRNLFSEFVSFWGKWLVNVGVDKNRNNRSILISKEVKQTYKDKNLYVFSSIWYHPSEICFWKIKRKDFINIINDLKETYYQNKDVVVAIWECWIDTHYPNWKETLKLQKEFFDLQCSLAQQLNLPIIIHSRNDFYSTFDVIKNYKNLKIYFHCWWYWTEEAKKLLNYFPNIWIGFAWNITYNKSNNIRESLKVIPLDNFVIETDAPYLTPQKVRWKLNKPIYVKYNYDFIANYLEIDLDKLIDKMEKNFKNLYLN